jgi:hypothetical protein
MARWGVVWPVGGTGDRIATQAEGGPHRHIWGRWAVRRRGIPPHPQGWAHRTGHRGARRRDPGTGPDSPHVGVVTPSATFRRASSRHGPHSGILFGPPSQFAEVEAPSSTSSRSD